MQRQPSAPKNPLPLLAAALVLSAFAGSPARSAEEEDKSPIQTLQVTAVDFWATWCKPCKMALPEVQKLHEKYADRGLSVIGVSLDGPRNTPKVRPFTQQLGLTFPNVIDEKGDFGRAFRILGLPTSILIAPDGKVVSTKMGYRPGEGERLAVEIEKLLLVPPDSTARKPAES
jgi:thiol-disulfide isomerase/thioredoxin